MFRTALIFALSFLQPGPESQHRGEESSEVRRESAPPSARPSAGPGLTGQANPGLMDSSGQTSVGDQSYRSTSKSNGKGEAGLTILDPEVYEETQDSSILPEYHVVAPGETMWGLTGRYYRDPYQWPLIWSINEQITNAHWIFPGDRVRVREGDGRGRLVDNRGQGRSGVRYVAGKKPKAAPKSYLVQRSFFLFDEEEDKVGKVVGSDRPSVMLAEGDLLYVSYDESNPPLPGERLAVYQPAETIRDFRTGFRGKRRKGKKLVKVVQIAAEVQVERLDDKSAAVTVVDSVRPVERGMWVGPLQPRFERMRQEKATVARKGLVVSCIDGYGMSGQRQFVVLNLGENAGVRPGNLVSVVRSGDAYAPINRRDAPEEQGHPSRHLATMVVVQTSTKASLAMVVDSKREILPGDPVLLSPNRSVAVAPAKARVTGPSPSR